MVLAKNFGDIMDPFWTDLVKFIWTSKYKISFKHAKVLNMESIN